MDGVLTGQIRSLTSHLLLFSPPHFLTGLTPSNPLYACRPGLSFLAAVLNLIQVWILQASLVRLSLRGRFGVRGHAWLLRVMLTVPGAYKRFPTRFPHLKKVVPPPVF